MRFFQGGVAVFAALTVAGAAAAHDSFIVPPGRLTAGQPIRLEVTSSSFFPAPESPIRPARVARIDARAGDTALVPTLAAGEAAMGVAFDWPTAASAQTGVMVAVDLSPWDIDVGADEIPHYMDEIGAPPEVRAAAEAAVARDGVMRETYAKHLKVFACAGACDGLDPARPSGSALEFVTAGDAFLLLEHSSPRAGQAVFVTTETRGRLPLITDESGKVRLPAGLSGPVFLSAVVLRAPAEAGGRFTSDWAALTFDAAIFAGG